MQADATSVPAGGPIGDQGQASAPSRRRGPLQRTLYVVGQCLLSTPRALAWLPPLAWAALIFYHSSGRLELGDLGVNVFGGFLTNLAHPGAFGILALLLIPLARRVSHPWGGGRWTGLTPEGGLWVVVVSGLYGFTDELHQSMVAGRDASALDLLADAVGALFVVLVVRYLGRRDATERGLRRRLLSGLLASVVAASASTAYSERVGAGPWPF